jgi:hypothetical protein
VAKTAVGVKSDSSLPPSLCSLLIDIPAIETRQ